MSIVGWLTGLLGDVRSYPRGKDKRLSADFHLGEWECKCGRCPHTLVSRKQVKRLQRLRNKLGRRIRITSGYRCEAHNAAVGGVPGSQHKRGTATDIVVDGMKPSAVASLCRDDFDGVGVYPTFLHLDSRGEPARWDEPGDAS